MSTDNLYVIMLIDDDAPTNFLNKRALLKSGMVKDTITMTSAENALEYLKKSNNNILPHMIFLDINMPGMNGWEFLDEYQASEDYFQIPVVVMLTTSLNPEDEKKAATYGDVQGFERKPLTQEKIKQLFDHYLVNLSDES
ncbi:response regulator [Croceivirga sp. JEA036]|uniref:response regulator n=1 Tax=Croceivirga sp. JEA036 TaxID=2721162 RepID=UPI001439188E|nr:response regulator [Croceivirga sp. JEA036]NJB35002.1 response regulator [Croceivirga sp. JEA036]